MDLKLRARLCAYSKIESIQGVNSELPLPDESNAGSMIGVGNNGNYTLIGKATQSDFDTQFGKVQETPVVPDKWIEDLFETPAPEDTVTKEEIDKLFPERIDESDAITKDKIDSLFPSEEQDTTVDKEEIDDLFDEPSSSQTSGTVSFAEIDSLFS